MAGNPPWVNWENLPEDYRDSMKPLWQRYGLFSLSGSAGRLGGGKKDLSMLFVYTAVDHYLETGARLGFVITQTVFKTKGAGDGFRQLSFEHDKKRIFMKPLVVHDLSELQVFEGATNRTSVLVCERQDKGFEYPVTYFKWSGPSRINQDDELKTVLNETTQAEMGAVPVDPEKPSSPWLTARVAALTGIQKVIGKSEYKAWEGVNTGGLNGCFWVRIVEKLKDGNLLIENLHDIGKIKLPRLQKAIEPSLVYPLLRGRDVVRWHASPSSYIILAQDPETRKGIGESEMKRTCPKTFHYFKEFEGNREKPERGTLRGRALYKLYFRQTDPFYSMYNVGPYSMEPFKVFWRQFIPELRMAVVRREKDEFLGSKVCLTQHVVSFVAFEGEEEAFYFSGCGNSSPATLLHWNSSTSKSYGQPHILETLRIPRYDPKDKSHVHIRDLAKRCHEAAIKDDVDAILAFEGQIDKEAAKLWGISDDELQNIREALEEARRMGRPEQDEADDDE